MLKHLKEARLNDIQPRASTVSVCMATYNGAAYLREQIDSIIPQLRDDDELLIVDDASADDSVEIIASYDDPRIRYVEQDVNRGYVRTFEHALEAARGDILLLSDQDDVWMPGRLEALAQAAGERGIAASNLLLLPSGEPLRSPLTGRPWLLRAEHSTRGMRNEFAILAGDIPYFGCTMAIRRDCLELVLPFPVELSESHDLWIATVANAARRMTHVEQPTLLRRVHDDNASTSRPRGILPALRSRRLLLRLWRIARRRLRQTPADTPSRRG